MKFSETWLREWIKPPLSREEICQTFTMGGLEVEELVPVAENFNHVIIGHVLKVSKHPQADRLHLCEVDVGQGAPLAIVCGANNVRDHLKVAVAMVGAVLPNNLVIKQTTIRGAASAGMLCSARELGMSEEAQGILELPADAPIGKDLREYFFLNDYIFDLSITPNRGDCLSIKGLARELSALTGTAYQAPAISEIKAATQHTIPIIISAKTDCPRYAGRVVRRVKADAQTPIWLKERLRRSGVRCISPIVDVTNYVMLELGQPMHAFDLATIENGINVRHAQPSEKILLLDGSEQTLDTATLVIADEKVPLAIAGVMGGLNSSVTLLTTDILLESAYFSPSIVAKQRQHYHLSSESAYRFERGIDPTIQRAAIERATQLILDIAGGEAGPIIEEAAQECLPAVAKVTLDYKKVLAVLGVDISKEEIENIFTRLSFARDDKNEPWHLQIPAYRRDITIAEDVIEEIARLYGYNKIPTHQVKTQLQINPLTDLEILYTLKQALAQQGYHEIISYSFVDKPLQIQLNPYEPVRELLNPISADMSVMRTNLWPGSIQTLRYNISRQQPRVRIFEMGNCFLTRDNKIEQQLHLSGLITGLAHPEQWGVPSKAANFYDLKGNLENLFKLSPLGKQIMFKPDQHPALHPGQTASIYYVPEAGAAEQKLGILGSLHPTVVQALDLPDNVLCFDLNLDLYLSLLKNTPRPRFAAISKFPEIRRDIAILVKQTIPAQTIQDTIRQTAGDWLKEVFIFDVYAGKGIAPGFKSIAAALILQHPTRTLVDEEIAERMQHIVKALQHQLGAELRSQ